MAEYEKGYTEKVTSSMFIATRGCTRSTRVEQESLAKITRTKKKRSY